MAKHHQHFTSNLSAYLTAGVGQRHKQQWHNKQQQLPDALKLSILRGESIFRQQFFGFFASKGFDDRFTYIAYQKMLVEGQVIMEFVQQIGLQNAIANFVQTGIANDSPDYQQQCYQLYCLLIDHLSQQDEQSLLHDATVRLVQHYLPSFFPKAHKVKPSLDLLKKQLRKALNTHWHCQVTIKESFSTNEELADFKLIAHVDKCYPTELIHISAKRLRSAKFQAYHQLLEQLSGTFTLKPTPKTANKKDPMRPLPLAR